MLLRLSPLQRAILLAVVRYRFLTCQQIALFRSEHLGSIRRAIAYLSNFPAKNPLLFGQRFPVYSRWGRLENVYSSTECGRAIAGELVGRAELENESVGTMALFDADFFHRRETITFRILLDLALTKGNSYRLKVAEYHHYFEKSGTNQSPKRKGKFCAKTRIPLSHNEFFVPDSILVMTSHNNALRAVYGVECIWTSGKSRTIRQVQQHMRSISERAIARPYRLPDGQNSLSLFFFRDVGVMRRVMKDLQTRQSLGFPPFRNHFLFATMADMRRDVLKCWRKVGDETHLYDFITGKKAYRLSS